MQLSTAISFLHRAASIIQDCISHVDAKSPDSAKIIYVVEQAQRLHEICHRLCSDSTQPYITDEAQERVLSEVSRLKRVIDDQKKLIYKLQQEATSFTDWDY